jgi:hypothetical protein
MNYDCLAIEEKIGQYIQVGTRIRRTRDFVLQEIGSQGVCLVVGNGICYVFENGIFVEYSSESNQHQNNKGS